MTSQPGSSSTGMLRFALVALVFFVPLIVASWLYYGGTAFQPEGRTNHGALLEPIVNVHEALPNSRAQGLSDGEWLLIYRNIGACEAACEKALHRLRQSHLMLGKDMDRVQRVFLHGDTPPDTVFIVERHQGLITLQDREWSNLLAAKRPENLSAGGLFLVDPLGNLVMYFAPEIDPGDMVDDIEHLLGLSRIG